VVVASIEGMIPDGYYVGWMDGTIWSSVSVMGDGGRWMGDVVLGMCAPRFLSRWGMCVGAFVGAYPGKVACPGDGTLWSGGEIVLVPPVSSDHDRHPFG